MNRFPYRYRILVFIFTLVLITYLDRICIALVGVKLKAEFQLTNEKFGWVLAAFSLAYALFELPTGILGDRIGQRAILIRIVLWFSFFTACTGLATGLMSLVLIRFLFGMGEAGTFPTSAAVVSHWFPVSETTQGLSAIFVGLNLGSALAPLLVIHLAADYGWRVPFFFNGLLGLIWVLACYRWFRNNPSEVSSISPEEASYIETNRRFRGRETHFSWREVLGNRSLRALVGAFFCSQWGNYFFISWMPVYLQEGKHFSESAVSLTTFSLFLSGIIVAWATGIFSDRMIKSKGLRFTRRLVGSLAQGGLCLCLLLMVEVQNQVMVAILLIAGHLFFAANGLVSFAACVDIGGSRAGSVAGIMNFFGQTGGFLLALSFGKIADLSHGFLMPVYTLAGVLLAGSLLWLLVDPTRSLIPDNDSRPA